MLPARIDQLTDAQRDCLRLVLAHHNSKEIAAILGVSPSAIDKRIERAVQILGVATRFEAARLLHVHAPQPVDADVLPLPQPTPLPPPQSPAATYERLPSEPIDVPNPPFHPAVIAATEPWGLVRRFLGLSRTSGSMGTARNRLSRGDRLVRLIGIMGVIAIASMALVNMAMTLTSLISAHRAAAVPVHNAASAAPGGRISMLRERRHAVDTVTKDFLKAEAAVDQAAMLAASCVSTLLQQRMAANLPVGTGAAALQMVSLASMDIINARQRFIDAHRALVDVRHDIGLGPVRGYGDTAECPPAAGELRSDAPIRLAAVA